MNYALTVTGGVSSCSVNPSLPAGLVLNTTTCAITGTPTATITATAYTITATNQYGSGTVTVTIGTTLVAPTAFSFPYTPGATTTYTIGTPVSVSPAITGVVTNCTASPTLPAGLSINTTTCAITGTPTTVSAETTYTITASNGSGNTATTIKVKVDDIPPSNLVYPFGSSTILAVGTAVSISPTITGGVTSCSPSPTLPTGLSINATTCTISGTPSAAKVATAYTITASNAYGNTNVLVTITAQLYAPSSISFPFAGGTVNYTTGVAVNVAASISGIVTSCSVSPSLPAGLTLNTTTCAITGTPTGTSPATNYTITASNASGSANTTVTIGVNPPAPSNLVYPSSNALSFAIGTAKTVTPTVTGTVTNCVANPTLPAGLTINAATCAIGGNATVEQTSTAYVITASNAGGNVIANITITVANPPANFTFPVAATNGIKNGTAINISPSITGSSITFSISPALPTGVTLNTSTGAITGAYTSNEGLRETYTVTATNSGGSATANLVLTFYGKPTYQTGQTQCYDASGNAISCAGTGQDGEYQAGLPLPTFSGPNQNATYTNDYTTTNTTTGIVWKTCAEGLSGSDCGTGSMLQNNSSGACSNLNSLNGGSGYAGRNDWRFPNANELNQWGLSYNFRNGFSTYFPGSQGNSSLSSPEVFVTEGGGMYVDLYRSKDTSRSGVSMYHLRCSTPGAPIADCIYRCVAGSDNYTLPKDVDNGDSTVIDLTTGLLWQKCATGASGSDCQTGMPTLMNWSDALNMCKNLTLNGKTWKLPNINEAVSFYKFPFGGTFQWDFSVFVWDQTYSEGSWTSTTDPDDHAKSFATGIYGRFIKPKSESRRVRCISAP